MEQLSLDQMLAAIPPQLLDQKIAKDIHLAELARSLTNWRAAISYLGLRDTDEEAIEEENSRLDAQRYVVSQEDTCIILAVAVENESNKGDHGDQPQVDGTYTCQKLILS